MYNMKVIPTESLKDFTSNNVHGKRGKKDKLNKVKLIMLHNYIVFIQGEKVVYKIEEKKGHNIIGNYKLDFQHRKYILIN